MSIKTYSLKYRRVQRIIAVQLILIFLLIALFRISLLSVHNTYNNILNVNGTDKLLNLQLVQAIQCVKTDNLPDGWCMDGDLKPRYIDIDNNVLSNTTADSSSFELKRYTIDGFEHCLANKTVVFIGESRARFQYMHLGLTLKTGQFMNCPDRQGYDVECLGIASLATYQSWRGEGGNQNISSWNDLFKFSTEMLQHSSESNKINQSTTPAIGTQLSLCDCFRPEGGFAYNHFFENRYTKRTTAFGEINLIHLENLKDRVSMNEDYPPYKPFYFTSSNRCKPGECGRWGKGNSVNNAWVGNLNSSLYDIIPMLNATHVFANDGWNFGGDVSCILNQFANYHPNIKVAYMGGPLDISGKHHMLDPRTMKCQIDALDRAAMTHNVPRTFYLDSVHVWSILNEEFNHRMMKMICPMEVEGL